ncbi:MAG: T9SS type A sorting domain-containing protein [candidate division Zixibacteria bacterium]|nr:T9SS type A sorting domain-containing protein [candidate division Zixibacteria bacterium]
MYTRKHSGYLVTLGVVLLLLAGLNCSKDSPLTPVEKAPPKIGSSPTVLDISIGIVLNQLQGHNASVSISLDSFSLGDSIGLGGFDFLVAYDASALIFISAEPGALIDNGKFEYFTYRFGPNGNCGDSCPSGMLRIVGMREYNNGVINPNHVAGPGELVKLNFFISNDRTLECFLPIQFYWLDCGDNTVVNDQNTRLFLAKAAFDYNGYELKTDHFSDYSLPADSCLASDTANPSQTVWEHSIIYHNGGIQIICDDPIDARGDMNLNHIPNEIGDAMVLTNYFINGYAAFTINVEGQIAASEVNGDGIALSVADLVYLIRIIVGDALPLAKISPDMVAQFSTDGQVVRVNTPTPIGAALFVFDGQAYPALADAANGMEIKYGFVNNETRVLVYSMDRGRAINSGDVLNISDSATLRSVEAATYEGAILATNRSFQLPTEFGIQQNYPNPFNGTTTIIVAMPASDTLNVTIRDITGRQVIAWDGVFEAGYIPIVWGASNLPAGIYLCTATAFEKSATIQMILTK